MSIELTPAVLARHAVLYVDDNEWSRTIFAHAVRSFVSVDLAETPEQALQMLQRRAYSIVVTDLRMPEMSGIDLCVQIRQLFPKVRRMLVTAYGDLETLVDAINRGGISHFVTKPWKNDFLVHAIKETLTRVELERTVESLQEDIKKREIELALGQQLGRIVHDLSGIPLPIRTALLDLRESLEDATMSERSQDLIRQQLATLNQVVDHVENILRRSRDLELSPPRRRRYRVLTALETTGAMVHRRHDRIQLEWQCDDPSLEFVGDLTDVTRILINLVRNAQNAIAERNSKGQILMTAKRNGTSVAIEILDNGPGISPQKRTAVFENGYTDRKDLGGNGLGLGICRELTMMNGGSLELADNPTGGCRFILRLPAAPMANLSTG